MHKPEVEKVDQPIPDAKQIHPLVENLKNEQYRLIFLLPAITRMRVGDALAICWMDPNATKCELSINHTLYKQKLKRPKTTTSKSTLKIAPSIVGLPISHKRQLNGCINLRDIAEDSFAGL
jgi:hypothetical protein